MTNPQYMPRYNPKNSKNPSRLQLEINTNADQFKNNALSKDALINLKIELGLANYDVFQFLESDVCGGAFMDEHYLRYLRIAKQSGVPTKK